MWGASPNETNQGTATTRKDGSFLLRRVGRTREPVSLELDSRETRYELIKDDKSLRKIQASIHGDQVRVSGPKKDDLQGAMQLLREHDFGIELSFGNYRG